MRLNPWIGLFIVVLIIVLPVFSHIDDAPIMVWDEGRLANSALEMYETGNPLVITYNYEPEMWSTKPPFLIWVQALFISMLGFTDMAIRLPISIATVITCLFLYWFFAVKFRKPWIGILTAAVLITTPGYVNIHGIRTGDYDAVLTLFTTLYIIYFFLFLEEGRGMQLFAMFLFLILATLTKGIAGVMLLPGMLIYAFYRKKVLYLLKMPKVYAGIVVFLIIVLGYYFLREQYNPGYIDAVMANELGGRYSTVIEGHKGSAWFYYELMAAKAFIPWLWIFIAGAIIGPTIKDRLLRHATILSSITAVIYIVFLSFGSTKLDWYLLPAYPFMSIVVAVFLYLICQVIYDTARWKQHVTHNTLPYIFLFLIILQPYRNTINYIMAPMTDESPSYHLTTFFKKISKGGYIYDRPMKVIFNDYHSGFDWYMKIFRLRKMPVERTDKSSLKKKDLVATYHDEIKADIEKTYKTHVVDVKGNVTLYEIIDKKPDSIISKRL